MKGRWLSLAGTVAFLAAWELVCRAAWVSPVLLSAPSEVATEALSLVRGEALWKDLSYTIATFAAALAIAVAVGAAIGATASHVAGLSALAGFAVHAIETRALVWRPEAFATPRPG